MDSLSSWMLSAQATRVLELHNEQCASAPTVLEREEVLFLECKECATCEVLL